MICENCGKEHNGNFGSGRFCCKQCARAFSTKNINRNELKETKCVECGKIIYIHKTAPTNFCKCNDCKNRYKYCPICGRVKVNGKCDNNFCQTHNTQQIKSLIKYFGFDKSKLKTIEVETEFNRIRNELYDLYWNQNLTSADILKKYNYPYACNLTQKIFKYLDIPSRNCKDTNKLNVLRGNYNIPTNIIYKHGWHTTWNNKEVYYRSQNELDYAIELDNQQIDYEMETLHIKYFDTQRNEYRCAIPDFYIPSKNEIVEIKSSYTLDLQNMKDKFKAYKELGYNCKCICDYKEIEI